MTETAIDQEYYEKDYEHPHQQTAAVAIAMMIGPIAATAEEQNQKKNQNDHNTCLLPPKQS